MSQELPPFRQPSISDVFIEDAPLRISLANATGGMVPRTSSRRIGPARQRTVSSYAYAENMAIEENSGGGSDITFIDNPVVLQAAGTNTTDEGQEHADESGEEWVYQPWRSSVIISYILFGNGRYKTIPIIWVTLSFYILIFNIALLMSKTNVTMRTVILDYIFILSFFLVNISYNLYFGYMRYSKDWIEETLQLNCHTKAAKAAMARTLDIIVIVALVLATFITCVVIAGDISEWKMYKLELSLGFIQAFICYLSIYILIGLWLWEVLIKHKVNENMVQEITYETLMDGTFLHQYHSTHRGLTRSSKVWSVNHVVRVLTCVPLAWWFVTDALEQFRLESEGIDTNTPMRPLQTLFNAVVLCSGISFYGIVWLAVAAGGFVNDQVYKLCVAKACTLCVPGTVLAGATDHSERAQYQTELLLRRSAILHHLEAIKDTEGLKFAGILLSVKNALTVGSILLTIMSMKL